MTNPSIYSAFERLWQHINLKLTNYTTKEYVDSAIAEIPTPDVSGQIETHNADTNAHSDIRTAVNGLKEQVDSVNTLMGELPSTNVVHGDAKTLLSDIVNTYILDIDYDALLHFDTTETVAGSVIAHLQNKYNFSYYSTMNLAVTDVNNGTIGENSDAEKDDAVAGVYTDENGGKNVVLLKDTTENAKITAIADMTINLGGNTLEFVNTAAGIATSSSSPANNFTVDGSLKGSTIKISNEDTKNTKALQFFSGNCTVIGGSYIANANGAGTQASPNACILVGGTANLTIYNASITANDYNGGALSCFTVNNGSSATITSCDINVTATDSKLYGIVTAGTVTVSNCSIKAYSNYTTGTETYYDALSQGVTNHGTLTLNDCYVMGTHSGIENHGTVTVNGGTYEGFGHGGFYFSGDDTTSYVRNAIIRDCEMPDGYNATANRNGAGFYIGSSVNHTVYMDNCDIYGNAPHQTIAIASSYGSGNHTLYISNSTINNLNGGIGQIRIDDTTHKLYIGAGNNFTADNTNLPEAVVVTNDVYIMNVT